MIISDGVSLIYLREDKCVSKDVQCIISVFLKRSIFSYIKLVIYEQRKTTSTVN